MREILFKAKRIDNGEWVEGSYIKSQPINEYTRTTAGMFVCNDNGMRELVLIDENTICQYTGLTDKNGCRIWENDIVRDVDGSIGKISYGDKISAFLIYFKSAYHEMALGKKNIGMLEIESIGNTFDNPELMKGE